MGDPVHTPHCTEEARRFGSRNNGKSRTKEKVSRRKSGSGQRGIRTCGDEKPYGCEALETGYPHWFVLDQLRGTLHTFVGFYPLLGGRGAADRPAGECPGGIRLEAVATGFAEPATVAKSRKRTSTQPLQVQSAEQELRLVRVEAR
jgi:hypothetical protein